MINYTRPRLIEINQSWS